MNYICHAWLLDLYIAVYLYQYNHMAYVCGMIQQNVCGGMTIKGSKFYGLTVILHLPFQVSLLKGSRLSVNVIGMN